MIIRTEIHATIIAGEGDCCAWGHGNLTDAGRPDYIQSCTARFNTHTAASVYGGRVSHAARCNTHTAAVVYSGRVSRAVGREDYPTTAIHNGGVRFAQVANIQDVAGIQNNVVRYLTGRDVVGHKSPLYQLLLLNTVAF